jgi:type I restriction enzyme S subunit
MMLFSCKSSESTNEFIWALLNSPGVQRQIRLLTAGAAAPRINIADIRKFKVVKPPYQLQIEFSQIVTTIRRQEDLSRRGLNESIGLFNSLTQRAFRGEL